MPCFTSVEIFGASGALCVDCPAPSPRIRWTKVIISTPVSLAFSLASGMRLVACSSTHTEQCHAAVMLSSPLPSSAFCSPLMLLNLLFLLFRFFPATTGTRRNAQRLDLQRGWAEEKGGLRRAAEDALRRVVDAKTRAEEEAALKVRARAHSMANTHMLERRQCWQPARMSLSFGMKPFAAVLAICCAGGP